MGKIDELINKIAAYNPSEIAPIAKRDLIDDLRQLRLSLPTQQDKVEVPELIHKWIKHVKGLAWGLADLLNPSASNVCIAGDVKKWLEGDKLNAEILARAWLEDDYNVIKEPLYYVAFGFDRFLVKGDAKFSDGTDFIWIETLEEIEQQGIELKHHFTENEIKAIDQRYWAFAVPVEEDE